VARVVAFRWATSSRLFIVFILAVVVAEQMKGAQMYELVRISPPTSRSRWSIDLSSHELVYLPELIFHAQVKVGEKRIVGEIIELEGNTASI